MLLWVASSRPGLVLTVASTSPRLSLSSSLVYKKTFTYFYPLSLPLFLISWHVLTTTTLLSLPPFSPLPAATFAAPADLCIDMAAITDPTNILNYTYATVNAISYKTERQNMWWCIYDALPLLESIIDGALHDSYDDIWAAIHGALQNTLLPGYVFPFFPFFFRCLPGCLLDSHFFVAALLRPSTGC